MQRKDDIGVFAAVSLISFSAGALSRPASSFRALPDATRRLCHRR